MAEELGDGGNNWSVVFFVVIELEEWNGEKFEVFWHSEGTWGGGV